MQRLINSLFRFFFIQKFMIITISHLPSPLFRNKNYQVKIHFFLEILCYITLSVITYFTPLMIQSRSFGQCNIFLSKNLHLVCMRVLKRTVELKKICFIPHFQVKFSIFNCGFYIAILFNLKVDFPLKIFLEKILIKKNLIISLNHL